MNEYISQYKIYKPPQPVGFWVLYELDTPSFQFEMFKKPTAEQIKNTQELLGWKWKDA